MQNHLTGRLHQNIRTKGHIIGVACGNGLSAKNALRGGADLILALNAGRFRQAGLGTLAAFLPFSNCNEMVMEFASREILPRIPDAPVLFGLCATDPTIHLPAYLDKIKAQGFAGISNYPTVGIIDGQFRDALEEEGVCYQSEVNAISVAHKKHLFTVAFVFTPAQAQDMLYAGADVICVHLGVTRGGLIGAKKVLSLEACVSLTREIFDLCDKLCPEVIKTIYGGPVNSTLDLKYMYDNTGAQGYLGGSAFDRIPFEQSIASVTHAFKTASSKEDELLTKMLSGISKHYDYVTFIKEYVAEHYANEVSFSDLASVAHVSRSYLSTLFKKEVGCTFPEYLNRFRIRKSIDLYSSGGLYWSEASRLAGYNDYAHFSRVFKKQKGISPKQFSAESLAE
ncbi:MAG: phosphoenolpyruvate hydrolase family protein [Christensenella sp.]|nr:phosphoenolpyruvate hydrolase family protein [Christensenella sp.]